MAPPHGSDLLEIEVDGELPAARRSDSPRREGGRTSAVAWVAVGTVAALVVLGVASAAFDAGQAPARSETPAATPGEADAVLAAASAAMSAWGGFAGTGDVNLLDGHFDPSGPQYRQLATEAAGITANGAAGGYAVETTGVVEELSGNRATVRASVLWRRGGEPEQQWEWSIDVRRGDHARRWLVWTVRTA